MSLKGTSSVSRTEGAGEFSSGITPPCSTFSEVGYEDIVETLRHFLKAADRFEQLEVLTNTVLVLVSTAGRSAEPPPDEAILADSIVRTLTDGSWSEFRTVLRLCEGFAKGQVRDSLLAADKLFASPEVSYKDIPVVVSVAEYLQTCDWVDRIRFSEWRDRMKALFLRLRQDSFDRIDDLIPMAKWVANNGSDLTGDDFRSLTGVFATAVRSATHASYSPNMDSIWIEMKERVEELQNLLSMDFSLEIKSIEQEINNAEKPDPVSYQVGKQIQPRKGSTMDSIFEALVQ